MPADNSLLVDGSLGAMCLLMVATFGVVWRLNERMGKVYGAVFDEPFGLVAMMVKVADRLDKMDDRLRALEHE